MYTYVHVVQYNMLHLFRGPRVDIYICTCSVLHLFRGVDIYIHICTLCNTLQQCKDYTVTAKALFTDCI